MGSSTSHETYLSSNKDEDGYCYYAVFEAGHFSEGATRYAFKGQLKGSGPRNGEACVVKVFKKQYARHFDDWVPDLAASKKSKQYADKFCERYLPSLGARNVCIDFIIPLVAKFQKYSEYWWLGFIPWGSYDTDKIALNEYMAVEKYIQGNYVKFNSNFGYEAAGLSSVIPAFTHWTWQVSGHRFMICDIQGVKSGDKYYLTDPAVHSAEQIYGKTDLGIVGMEKVMRGHKCNELCRRLNLVNPLSGAPIAYQTGTNTTYSFQLTEEQLLRNKEMRSPYFTLEVIAQLNFQ